MWFDPLNILFCPFYSIWVTIRLSVRYWNWLCLIIHWKVYLDRFKGSGERQGSGTDASFWLSDDSLAPNSSTRRSRVFGMSVRVWWRMEWGMARPGHPVEEEEEVHQTHNNGHWMVNVEQKGISFHQLLSAVRERLSGWGLSFSTERDMLVLILCFELFVLNFMCPQIIVGYCQWILLDLHLHPCGLSFLLEPCSVLKAQHLIWLSYSKVFVSVYY